MKKMHAVPNRYADHPLWMRILIPILVVLVAVGALVIPSLIAQDVTSVSSDVLAKYSVGSLAENDIKATETFHYVDEAETAKRQRAATQAVLPRFRVSLITSQEILNDLDTLFTLQIPEHIELDSKLLESLSALTEEQRNGIYLIARSLLEDYVSQGVFSNEDFVLVRESGYTEIQIERNQNTGLNQFEKIISLEAVFRDVEVAERVHADLKMVNSTVSTNHMNLIFDSIHAVIRPNVHFDPVATTLARDTAAADVSPVITRVEKGELILKKDFVITQQDIKTLQALRLASVQYPPSQLLGRALFVIITTISAVYGMFLVFENSKRRYQYLFIFLVGVLVTELLLYLAVTLFSGRGYSSLDPFLPLFILPILFALVTNRKRAGMICALLLSSYAILLPSSTEMTVFFVVAISFFGIYFIKYVSRRVDMVFQWLFGIVATSCIVLFTNLLNGYGFNNLLTSLTAIAANMSFTYIMVTLLLPLIELIFNLPTPFRLRELAYSDSPALVRLSQTAVGTYNHSLIVAEMAYSAAKEIQADPLLARVSGLYHDIGKQEHPEYFIENQSGDNKHDDLKASLSVAIIKSHVKIGVEKGREARLPQEVLDIISQHHGNDVIAIFLKEAQLAAQNEKDRRQVKRQDYAYNNQIPQSPEAAIVMLADSIEAASRTIKKPSAQKYEKLVNQIVMSKMERKQLGASRLSLTDLETIERVFVQILTGRFHTRIEYPEEQEKERT